MAHVNESTGIFQAREAFAALLRRAEEHCIFGDIHFGIPYAFIKQGLPIDQRSAMDIAGEHAGMKLGAGAPELAGGEFDLERVFQAGDVGGAGQ